MPGMDGKTAIVTGGATLIGAAVVRAFRAAGANVAVADIDAEAGERLAAELGDGVLFLATDIRDDAADRALRHGDRGGLRRDRLPRQPRLLLRRRGLRVAARRLARVART